MKKLLLSLCCIFVATGIFASKEIVPTSEVLSNYYDPGQLCVAIYFEEEICSDIVFVGTYNGWSTLPDEMAKFVPIEGFDGWWVVAVDYVADNWIGVGGMPIQLRSDGSLSWYYQTGDVDSWTLVSGYAEITPDGTGYAKLTNCDNYTPVVLISSYFHNHMSPCHEVYRTYTINLKAPNCGGFEPAIFGDFNGWSEGVPMVYNEENRIYSYSFTDLQGHQFTFKAATDTDWSNWLQLYNPIIGEWTDISSITLGEEEIINLDYSMGRWTLCDDVEAPSAPVPSVPGTSLPLHDFEDANGNAQWILLNGGQPNYWTIGNATAAAGTNSLYITNNGSSYGYDYASSSCAWAYLSSTVQGNITISFDWQGEGEGNYDHMRAYLLPADFIPEIGSEDIPNNAISLGIFNSQNTWQHFEKCLTLGESNYYLAFMWRNDASIGSSPIAIDNVEVVAANADTYQLNITAGTSGYLTTGDFIGAYSGGCSSPTLVLATCAEANYGYTFAGWSDGVTDECRTIYINSDTTITALFAERERAQVLVGVADESTGMGSVSGSGIFYEQEYAYITATPNEGYHFVEWSDGNGYATRYVYLTSDTTLFATFAKGDIGGKCGKNLYWVINNDSLIITGYGDMDLDNYSTWRGYGDWGYYFYTSYLSLPDGITSISSNAFRYFYLSEVIVPASVTYIGSRAFADNYNLQHFEYQGNQLTSASNALYDCYNLRYFKGVSYLIESSYNVLDTIIITNDIAYYNLWGSASYIDNSKANDYYYTSYDPSIKTVKTLFLPEWQWEIYDFELYNARYLETITIPENVTYIGESAFEECRSLESVVFAGNNVETIDDWAFYNCHELKEITIPEGVTSIGKSAFFNCTYLAELTIPSSMQRIAENGFGACTKLERMYVNAVVPPVIEAKTFEDVDRSIPVFVPRGTMELYQANQYWQEFFHIEEYDAPTGISNGMVDKETGVRKVLKDGQVLILRDGKVYDILGQSLK